MPLTFLDSNILIYSASADACKAATSRDLILQGGVISVQVLNETANVARNRMRLAWGEVEDLLLHARALLKVEPITIETHSRGLALMRRHRMATYDSMIVAAALIAGCDTLYSEDMHGGLVVDGSLTIVNPFV